jgi:predicted nucleic acid-binding protein
VVISHLADTSWIIELLRGRDEAERLLRPLIDQGSLATSIIVYGELYEGVLRGPSVEFRLANLNELLVGLTVLGIDLQTAEVFARTRSELRERGELIPDHDTWIAATALRHDLTLLTRDQHFARVRDLKLA